MQRVWFVRVSLAVITTTPTNRWNKLQITLFLCRGRSIVLVLAIRCVRCVRVIWVIRIELSSAASIGSRASLRPSARPEETWWVRNPKDFLDTERNYMEFLSRVGSAALQTFKVFNDREFDWERSNDGSLSQAETPIMSVAVPRVAKFEAATARLPDYVHVVLITTGSVASVKAPLIVKELLQVGFLCCCNMKTC